MSETAIETRPAWEWRAMGATWRLRHTGKVEIEVVGALADAIAADERRWSRFLPRSEVSRLNRAPGVPLQVSTETLDLLLSCDRWHEQTDGAFSVMVGGALIEYGYRESQRVRPPRTSRTPRPAPIPSARPRWCGRSPTIPRSCSRSATTWSRCAATTSSRSAARRATRAAGPWS